MSKTAVELAFERHIEFVSKKDREAYIANFSEDSLIEDPVGKSPLDPSGQGHRGHAAIGAFCELRGVVNCAGIGSGSRTVV